MKSYQTVSIKQFSAFLGILCCCLFVIATIANAELVTAHTFELDTELEDIAEMLGHGGVA